MLSKSAKYAFEAGYRIKGCRVVNTKTGNARKLAMKGGGGHGKYYPTFNFGKGGKTVTCKAHHLAAWQKFGALCIGRDVHIRHWDDNPYNFKLKNTELGTRADNFEDKRRNRAAKESQF